MPSSAFYRRNLRRETERGASSNNQTAAIVGQELEISEDVQNLIRETHQNDLDENTKRNYRNRLKEIYTYWLNKHPEYYGLGTYDITPEEKRNPDRFWHKNERDIKYDVINIRFVLAFLAEKKKLEGGKICSYTTIRKYNDAILWGSHQAGEVLPLSYIDGMNAFLKGYKKETVRAKMDGNLNEEEADAIPFDLFLHILNWALGANNVFVWVFSILQWNFIARSIDIGVIGLRNFRAGIDNLICRYDKSKADQYGERCHDKHFYSNPVMPVCDIFGALGVWLSIERERFRTSDGLFKSEGTAPN